MREHSCMNCKYNTKPLLQHYDIVIYGLVRSALVNTMKGLTSDELMTTGLHRPQKTTGRSLSIRLCLTDPKDRYV